MINKVRSLVEEACKDESNHFGYGIWTHHIKLVVQNASKLARILGGDEEVCELGALLHDYASVFNYEFYSEHHLHSARLAGEVLTTLQYPLKTILSVQECIKTHRGSQGLKPPTIEAQVLANADAMAHFQSIDSLFYLAYVQHKKGIDEGREWILEKLERSWNKLIPEAQQLVKDNYEAAKILFDGEH